MPSRHCPPLVLAIGGHDPSGAGIQADIETAAACGCMAVTVITALTTQNTRTVRGVAPCTAAAVVDRVKCLLDECRPRACKIGLLPNGAVARALARLFALELADVPLVLDPVLRAGSGGALGAADKAGHYLRALLPLTSVATPNLDEARCITGCATADAAAARLLAAGCKAVLVTDVDDAPATITNRLFGVAAAPVDYTMERFPGVYHGTGCTLASAIACALAARSDVRTAVERAQRFVHASVAHAHDSGAAQRLPDRFFAWPR